MRVALYSSLLVFVSVGVVQAQEFSGTMTFGVSRNNIGGLPGLDAQLSTTTVDVATNIRFNDSLSLGVDFGLAKGRLGADLGAEVDIELISMGIAPVYHFANGSYLGGYYITGDNDLSVPPLPISFGIDTKGYGLFGGFNSGAWGVEAFVGRSDTSPSLDEDLKINDLGLSASYAVNEKAGVFGSFVQTNVDMMGSNLATISAMSIGMDYAISDKIAAYGSAGVLNLNIDGLEGKATGFTLGMSYDMTAAAIPMVLSAELTKTNANIDLLPTAISVDRVAFGVTIPLNGGSKKALNSNTRSGRGEYRSAIAALANSF